MSKKEKEQYAESLGIKLNDVKREYDTLSKRKEELENSFNFDTTSSEDWINISDEINDIEDKQAIAKTKIEE